MAEKFTFTKEELDKMVLDALKEEEKGVVGNGKPDVMSRLLEAANANKVAK
jgi:ABC-type branched-subunit amino acid transport system substrate-binding protein